MSTQVLVFEFATYRISSVSEYKKVSEASSLGPGQDTAEYYQRVQARELFAEKTSWPSGNFQCSSIGFCPANFMRDNTEIVTIIFLSRFLFEGKKESHRVCLPSGRHRLWYWLLRGFSGIYICFFCGLCFVRMTFTLASLCGMDDWLSTRFMSSKPTMRYVQINVCILPLSHDRNDWAYTGDVHSMLEDWTANCKYYSFQYKHLCCL